MKVSDFDYNLPPELIAQSPIKERTSSKLMVMDRVSGEVEHQQFFNIIDYLEKGDVLVLNNTKVIPARLYGYKSDTQAKLEVLLLKKLKNDIYSALIKPAKKVKEGTKISFSRELSGEIIQKLDEGIVHIHFYYQGVFLDHLNSLGHMPLPPYIHQELSDNSRYQTVYANALGSAAAPTAGLHFTTALLNALEEKGIIIAYVTLHVGLGTFRPLSVENIEEHKMHSEYYELDEQTARILNLAKHQKRRIISVGTTSTRLLESNLSKYGLFKAQAEETDIFIYPGYKFKAIDALITNFHLPRSSLLMLVSAFSTKDNILKAYEIAIENKYRFFSFGDAMFIK